MRTVLYHITPKQNKRSILAKGLDPSYSRGKLRAVWFSAHPTKKLLEKTAKRHKVNVSDLIVLQCAVLSTTLRKHFSPSCFEKTAYYSGTVVSPKHLALSSILAL